MAENPYASPEHGSSQSPPGSGGVVKYIVATLGALLVFGGAFLAIMLIPALIFPSIYMNVIGIVLMYVVGFALATLAAVLSFRGTLRTYARK